MRRAIREHLGSRDVARVIYGAVIGLAVVVALGIHPPSAGQALGAIAGTAIAVGLAEIYSDLIGEEARTRRPVPAGRARSIVATAGAVVLGAGFPVVFFVLAVAGIIETETAFTISKWTGLGLLCAYGFVAGRLSGSGIGRASLHALSVGAIGGALIALKALLH
jgi:hypothetical protein